MKKIQLYAFLFATTYFAANIGASELDPTVATLKTTLNLSDKQTQELNTAYVDAHYKTQALRQQIRLINNSKQERLNAILTTEQKKKYQELQNTDFPAEAEPPQIMP